jgi:hypothetical protein
VPFRFVDSLIRKLGATRSVHVRWDQIHQMPAVPSRPASLHPGDQQIQMALEEDAVFTSRGTYFLDGRQTKIHLIK